MQTKEHANTAEQSDEELYELLITISVLAKRLARALRQNQKEDCHES